FRILDYAMEKGLNLLDTAEAYGAGASETVIGRWLHSTGLRGQIVLQTKTLSHRRSEVARAKQASLQPVQTDRIDLYLLHRFNDDVPLEGTMEPIADAIRSGTIGAVGCSNTSVAQLRRALEASRRLGFPQFEVTQPMYNLVGRDIETEFL